METRNVVEVTQEKKVVDSNVKTNSISELVVCSEYLNVRDSKGNIIGLLKKGDVVASSGTKNVKGMLKVSCNVRKYGDTFEVVANDINYAYVDCQYLKEKSK